MKSNAAIILSVLRTIHFTFDLPKIKLGVFCSNKVQEIIGVIACLYSLLSVSYLRRIRFLFAMMPTYNDNFLIYDVSILENLVNRLLDSYTISTMLII